MLSWLRIRSTVIVVVVSEILQLAVPAVAAPDVETWPVEKRLVGKNGKKSTDVSGIACATAHGFPRACLVIDDNLQEAQFVTVKDREIVAGDSIRLIDDEFEGKPLELDGEGVSFANGFYYVIGSHGHPRDKDRQLDPSRDAKKITARIAASSQLVRIKIGPSGAVLATEKTNKLREIIASEPALRPFLDRRLENNGVTIEGIAVRQGRVLAGFRGPTLEDGRAAILSVSLDALFGGGAVDTRLYRLRLGDGQGVRDLALLDGGILILAGPSAEGAGPYAIYWWAGDTESVRFLKELSEIATHDRKPEAILPLEKGPSGMRVLILFDGEKEGGPVAVEVPAP